MEIFSRLAELNFFAFFQVLLVIAVALGLNFVAKKHYAEKSDLQSRLQSLQALLVIVALIMIILIAPIGDSRRGQLLSLFGIVLSAAVALSSTTVLGNAMAGLMLRSIHAFKPGDYIIVEDHAGRVTEMDLLHTEIQTEDSDLTTLSNIFMVTHPFRVIRSQAGTIISAQVGLGYDVPHDKIASLLKEAVTKAGLSDPFVQVLELGDFSVSYRAAGILRPAKGLISARSSLRAAILDTLHGGDIEIVSPNFMNTRALAEDMRFVPAVSRRKSAEPSTSPDDLVFDKADEAESLESMRQRHKAMLDEISEATEQLKTASEDETSKLTEQIAGINKRAERLSALIDEFKEKLSTPE